MWAPMYICINHQMHFLVPTYIIIESLAFSLLFKIVKVTDIRSLQCSNIVPAPQSPTIILNVCSLSSLRVIPLFPSPGKVQGCAEERAEVAF